MCSGLEFWNNGKTLEIAVAGGRNGELILELVLQGKLLEEKCRGQQGVCVSVCVCARKIFLQVTAEHGTERRQNVA